jgi:hypothetical protein
MRVFSLGPLADSSKTFVPTLVLWLWEWGRPMRPRERYLTLSFESRAKRRNSCPTLRPIVSSFEKTRLEICRLLRLCITVEVARALR